jgi:hypothetical protein
MSRLSFLVLGLAVMLGTVTAQETTPGRRVVAPRRSFEVDVLVDGRPLPEYYSRSQLYVEALRGAEYEVRLRNPTGERVAVALLIDGLNTIDASCTSAWDASKWVIGPYETITISGWQMNSERARKFYFTTERDSYAAKRGITADIGLISAVFYRERRRVISVTPPRPMSRDDVESATTGQSRSESQSEARAPSAKMRSEDAATGIGRSIRNDVDYVDMDLESRPAAEVRIRYEYCDRRCR